MQHFLLAINCVCGFLFCMLFVGIVKGHSNQFVSNFWSAVNKQASRGVYFAAMWLLSAAAALPMLAAHSPGYDVGAFAMRLMSSGHELLGAVTVSAWLTMTFTAGLFAIGTVVFYVWTLIGDFVRGKPGPVVVG